MLIRNQPTTHPDIPMPNSRRQILSVFILAATVTGCTTLKEAVISEDANYEQVSSMALGQTKIESVKSQFGEPDEVNKRWVDGYDSEVYFYKQQVRQDSISRPLNTQALVCEFNKGVLVGYTLNNTNLKSGPGFDNQDRPKLIKNKTSWREVESIFGTPTMKSLLPSSLSLASLSNRFAVSPLPIIKIPEGVSEIWQYVNEVKEIDGETRARRTLTIFFDHDGIYLGSSQTQELVIGS